MFLSHTWWFYADVNVEVRVKWLTIYHKYGYNEMQRNVWEFSNNQQPILETDYPNQSAEPQIILIAYNHSTKFIVINGRVLIQNTILTGSQFFNSMLSH